MKKIALLTLLASSSLVGAVMSAEDYLPDYRKETAKIPWLKDTLRKENRVWQTKYDTSKKETGYQSRIVSYGGKWSRHSYGGHGGVASSCGWRYAKGPLVPSKKWGDIVQIHHNVMDVDGDGDTKDDFIASIPFSMDVPHGIPDWPAANVFPERLNGIFYGGTTFYCANNNTDKINNFSMEMGINCDHSPPYKDSRAEDHPINGARHIKMKGSFLKHYVNMTWKKEDFLNNGDKNRISFDDNSRLSVMCTRGYWYGWNDIRFIVKNNGQFYISDIEKNIPDYAFKNAGKLKKPSGFNPICYPTKRTWTEYNPKGYKIDIDPAKCKFKKMKFENVEAVGWYLAKTDTANANTHCKWYGFEADAVVHTPKEPSPKIEMKEIKAKTPFYMATCELPYSLWQDIEKYGDSPAHILQARYVYDKSGSMGSMLFGKKEHGHDEPLTDITFYDALAICNTLSEMEGKTPTYYLDPEFKNIFRNQHVATYADWGGKLGYNVRNFQSPVYHKQPQPKIHVKWQANGHRLPTVSEWKVALGTDGLKIGKSNGQEEGTVAVGTGVKNSNGLYDMIGNVWELCWTFGDVYDPEKNIPVTALGGGFNYPNSPESRPISVYGDTPFNGDGNIGIRLVCRDTGLAKPEMGKGGDAGITMSDIPQWNFKKDDVFGKKQNAKPVSEAVMDMVKLSGGSFVRHDKMTVKVAPFEVSKYITTYDRWKTVKQWAEAYGYTFGRSGDIGSMNFFDFTHHPDEPVTSITWHDMITWCNALSEMEGKTPCYYYDEARTKVVRNSLAYKAIKVDGAEYIKVKSEQLPVLTKGYLDGSYAIPYIFTSWDEDGYRLPTGAEVEFATRGGVTTTYSWGNDESKWQDYIWGAENSKGRTHKVGLKKANPYGLFDMQGNVFEWSFSGNPGGDKKRPYSQDLDNPNYTSYWAWGEDKKEAVGVRPARTITSGPSYLYGAFNINRFHGIAVESSGSSGNTHYYQDISFRPVRCEKGTHPKDGIRPLVLPPVIKYLNNDKSKFYNFGE